MSNTGQTDLGFNGEYHHDINLLLTRQEYDADTIHSLKSQVEFEMNEKGLARIKRNEYAKRIAELEKELNDYKVALCEYANQLCKIKDVVSGFNNGIQILTCDGMVHLTLSEYNALVSAINATE